MANPSPLQAKGHWAETIACQYLESQQLTCVLRNYRCRAGEIDLIMLDNKVLVFVEVRYRRQSSYGSPTETIQRRKQQKIYRAATHYLINTAQYDKVSIRFDVVGIQMAGTTPQIDWIQHAFYPREWI
jgi:putative endonuclease